MTDKINRLNLLQVQVAHANQNPECFETGGKAFDEADLKANYYFAAADLGLDRIQAAELLSLPPVQ